MDDIELIRKKKRNKAIVPLSVLMVFIMLVGITYGLYNYSNSGLNNQLIVGDIYMRYWESNEIRLSNVTPSSTYDPNGYFEFTITGKNTTKNKDIWYDIQINHGTNHETRTERINDKFLKFRLVEVINNEESEIINGVSFNTINNTRIYADSISKNTTTDVTHIYRLYMWISDEVLVGTGDNVDYDMETWNNEVYASIKVNVTGDFTEKSLTETITEGCYTIEANTLTQKATITNYNYNGSSCGATVNIPSTIDGYTVTSIGGNSFSNKNLTSVTIPNSVITIGAHAFYYNHLTSVTIPDSVKTIGECAFDTNDLTSVTLGNSVETIGQYAFVQNELTSVVIPNSVVTIRDYAFDSNSLTSVTLGNHVETIGTSAFGNTVNPDATRNEITSIVIPDSVVTIGDYAFESNKLTTVTLGNHVETIGNYAFSNYNITSITDQNNNLLTLLDGNQITSIVIPDSVTYLGQYAFAYNALTSVTIGNGVTEIGDSAFGENLISTLTIGSSVETIGSNAFARNRLTGVTIPNSVTEIWDEAFNYNNLTSVTLGSGLQSMYTHSFYNDVIDANDNSNTGRAYGANNLSSVVIPSSVTNFYGDCLPPYDAFADSVELIYEDSNYNYCS